MAGRRSATAEDKPDTVELVSPDGEQTRTVVVGSVDEVKARWDGFLPAEQAELKAPEVPTPDVEQTVGTNA